MRKPEILSPAGNFEKLKAAIDFGADAVYLGGSKLNLRAFADNFDNEELTKGIKYAHDRGRKVYITMNVFAHNEDLEGLEQYLKELYELGADAIIASDPGIIMTAREVVPELEVHLSTQANNVNYRTANFWYKQGVKRIVLARELSLEEIKTIRDNIPEECELEAFVHGAMCMSYSGRCFLSNYLTGRDANRGACAQPCRYNYYLVEEKRPGEYFPVVEDEKGTYIMNSKDLCMIEYIPELVRAGITSFKIEGRIKSTFYAAVTTKAYREALDLYWSDPAKYQFKEKWLNDLDKVSHRQYHTGFYFGEAQQVHDSSAYVRNYDIVGLVTEIDEKEGRAVIEQKNRVFENDKVSILRPVGDDIEFILEDMKKTNGQKIDVAPSPRMLFSVKNSVGMRLDDIIIKQK